MSAERHGKALIGMGANLGDRAATLTAAIKELSAHDAISVLEIAEPVVTEPVGGPADQPEFLNSAALLETTLSPEMLLQELLRIEAKLGRIRSGRWEPRVLDLDLLLFDDQIRLTPELILPHPWLPFRDFVLEPAVTIAAEMRHPILGRSIYEMRRHLQAIPYWFVLDGGERIQREQLSIELAGALQGNALIAADTPSDTAEFLSPHETPPMEIYLSSVDWTREDVSPELPLRLLKPGRENVSFVETYLHARRGNRPIPKARLMLCNGPNELYSQEQPRRTPLYEMMSPLPTLRLDAGDEQRLLGDALAAIMAMTVIDPLR